MIIVAIFGGIAILAWAAWQLFHVDIAKLTFIISKPVIELYVSVLDGLLAIGTPKGVVFLIFSEALYIDAPKNIHFVIQSNVHTVPAAKIAMLWEYSALLIRPIVFLSLPFITVYIIRKTRASRKNTRENIYSLAKRMAPLFPQIRIAIFDKKHKGGSDLGPYRREDTPIRFAIMHGMIDVHDVKWDGELVDASKTATFDASYSDNPNYLVVIDHLDKGISKIHERCRFNEDKATEVFLEQLDEHWTSIHDLSYPLQLLFCAIALYAKGDKDRSYQLFWEINNKWNPNKSRHHLRFPDNYLSNLIAEVEGATEVIETIKNHAYISTVFQGLLARARKRGRLPSNLFYWLKKENRPMWYALNQEGGQCGWTEAGAHRAHVLAERAVKKAVGEYAESALYTPAIRECVKAIYELLYKEGWIAEIYPSSLN